MFTFYSLSNENSSANSGLYSSVFYFCDGDVELTGDILKKNVVEK